MIRSFVKLFDLEILHDYYIAGKSDDFVIQATADTSKLIKGYRSLLKTRSSVVGKNSVSGLAVVYEATDAVLHTPLIPITAPVSFRFSMNLVNPLFQNFTELPVKNNADEVYYYTNTGGATLVLTLIELQSKIFTYVFNSAGTPDQLRIFGPDGVEIIALRKNLVGGPAFEVQLNLQGYPDGKYKLELFDNNITIGEFKHIYFDSTLKSEKVFGIIEIVKAANDFPFDQLKIQFTKSDAFWKYFVVVKKGVGTDTYDIEDGEDGGPYIDFSKVVSPSPQDQATMDALLADLPEGDVILFKSTTEVEYSEVRKKELQLIKNAQLSPPLISNLPNPEVANPKAEAFVFV